MMRPYHVRLLRVPYTEWDVLASNMSEAKAKVLADEPRLKWIDLGVSVPGGRPTFPEDDE